MSQKIYRYAVITVLTVFILLAARPADAKTQSGQQPKAEKIIVFIIDDMGIEDVKNPKLKNINFIARSGVMGLMNTRTKSFSNQNRQSAYLTIGMGTRVSIPKFQGEMKNLIDSLKTRYPEQVPGKLGQAANMTGSKIALVGNSESDNRYNFTLLAAMDSLGKVDAVYFANNTKSLLYSLNRAVAENEIIFVDLEATTRVAEAREGFVLKGYDLEKDRNRALEKTDLVLGQLIEISEKYNAVLLVISPTSPVDNNFTGIKNLSPVFLYKKGAVKGILTSNSTRREGLISNIDIAPGIFAFLGVNTSIMEFAGEKITVLADSNPLSTVEKNYHKYLTLKKFRYLVHGVYVILMLIVLIYIFIPITKKKHLSSQRLARAISAGIIGVPVISSVSSMIFNEIGLITVSFIALLLLTAYLLSFNFETTMSGIAVLSLATSVLLLLDLFNGAGNLVNTPLGFNDVFTGGRYYGINNDSMGILLGSTVYGLFYLIGKYLTARLSRIMVTAGVMVIVILSQTPGFGANVGGTIAAITTGTLACIILFSGQRPTIKSLFLVVIIALMAELAVSMTDILSENQTHAGKTAARLLTDNAAGYLIEIIGSKLSVFLAMLVLPPWNLIFFLQLYFYRKILFSNVGETANIEKNNPLINKSFQVIFYGAVAAFIFNDTGIIASAMMLIYLTVPLGMLLVREGCHKNEYRQGITQRI